MPRRRRLFRGARLRASALSPWRDRCLGAGSGHFHAALYIRLTMDSELEKKIREALANPQNMGELANADAIGTVGNTSCGEMLRMWIKFKEDRGKKVIDQATFQSFGCETAIAV